MQAATPPEDNARCASFDRLFYLRPKSKIVRRPDAVETEAEGIEKARAFAKWLQRAAVIIAIWGFVYPRPYELAMMVLAVIPLVVLAVLLRANGLYDMEGRRNEVRPSLAYAFMAPAVILGFRALLDTAFLEWKPLLLWSLLLGVVMTSVIARADRRMKAPTRMFLFVFTAFYAYALLAQADTLLDRSQPAVFETIVHGKRSSDGRTTTYYLLLDRWGPRSEPNEVSVVRSFYNSIAVRDTVCVHVSRGALRMPWYFIARCE